MLLFASLLLTWSFHISFGGGLDLERGKGFNAGLLRKYSKEFKYKSKTLEKVRSVFSPIFAYWVE